MKAPSPRHAKRWWLAVALLIVAAVVAALIVALRPPSQWAAIKPGMSRVAVHTIIPEFDQPWGDIKADFEYDRRGAFTWRLAVSWQGDQVHMVEKELWTSWPEQRRLRAIILQ